MHLYYWSLTSSPSPSFPSLQFEVFIAYVCILIEILGLTTGISVLSTWQCLGSILCHFCGTFLTFWFALESWSSDWFIYILLFGYQLPALGEIFLVTRYIFQESSVLKKYEFSL